VLDRITLAFISVFFCYGCVPLHCIPLCHLQNPRTRLARPTDPFIIFFTAYVACLSYSTQSYFSEQIYSTLCHTELLYTALIFKNEHHPDPVQCLKQFATGLSPWRPGVDSATHYVRCIVKWHWARFVLTSFFHCRCYSFNAPHSFIFP
jgi:hypothetical protein